MIATREVCRARSAEIWPRFSSDIGLLAGDRRRNFRGPDRLKHLQSGRLRSAAGPLQDSLISYV